MSETDNAINPVPGVGLTEAQVEVLSSHFGQRNLEEALIFIQRARDPKGLLVIIEPDFGMVRDVLEAIHREPLGALGDPSAVKVDPAHILRT